MELNLIDKNKYQVFLCACPANIPINFASHPWFVVNKKGTISRWEVSFEKNNRDLSWGHLNKNLFPPFQGIEMFPFCKKYFWKSKILGYVEGDENSLAKTMSDFIDESDNKYQFSEKYSLIGQNSNTYAQWVLNHFPEAKMKLPWNAFGKNKLKFK